MTIAGVFLVLHPGLDNVAVLNCGWPIALLELQKKSLRDDGLASAFVRVLSFLASINSLFLPSLALLGGRSVVILAILFGVFLPSVFYLLCDTTVLEVFAALLVVMICEVYNIINVLDVLIFFLRIRALDLSLLISQP
jgi:hypothetical protein